MASVQPAAHAAKSGSATHLTLLKLKGVPSPDGTPLSFISDAQIACF